MEINEKGNCPPFVSILQEASDGNSKCQLWGEIAKGSFWPKAINPRRLIIAGVILFSNFHAIMPQYGVSSGEVKMKIGQHEIKQVSLS